jgi:AcrR family transcriptional regulator
MTDLRERQRTATREQIVQAVHDLLAEEHPATLSMPQVAERAGTSLRTLYRYFPTKEALVDAASESFRVPDSPLDVEGLPAYLRTAWRGFSEALPAVKAQHTTPAGRALREARLPHNRAGVRGAVEREGIELHTRDAERLVDLLVALISSSMYLELVDRLGHDDQEAADLASFAAVAVLERARREGALTP